MKKVKTSSFLAGLSCVFIALAAIFAMTASVGCAAATVAPDAPALEQPLVEDFPTPSLKQGSKGEEVKALQRLLGVTVDGDFGPKTHAAVVAFQKANGINPSGLVGPLTWAALRKTQQPAPVEPAPVEPPVTGDAGAPMLAWEASRAGTRPWSEFLYSIASEKKIVEQFSKAKDWGNFCPKFQQLSHDKKAHAISALIVSVARYESSFNPLRRYYETTMGYYSEGLLQLSYPDKAWAPFCAFDEKADMKIPISEKRTILNPYTNLNCGVRIMANLAESRGAIALSKGAYWAVLIPGGRYTKLSSIQAEVKKLPFCN